MRQIFFPLLVICTVGGPLGAAAGEVEPGHLILPARGVSVALRTGEITNGGVSGQCLETVSTSGAYKLVVSRQPGDDVPNVKVNGEARSWVDQVSGAARLGSFRLSRRGSLSLMRTWKTGDRQTELLQDGKILHTWERGTAVRLLRAGDGVFHVLEKAVNQSSRLVKLAIDPDRPDDLTSEVLINFGTCHPGRVYLRQNEAWAQMQCEGRTGSAIYRVPLDTGQIGEPAFEDRSASLVKLPRSLGLPKGETVAVVSGSPAAKQFYYAATGLLLSQTGEARACSSDAEGLQSWNQSYRLRALATLYEKTGAPVFSGLARKSMRLTLAARDRRSTSLDSTVPACGWGSTIYSSRPGSRLYLMINQAMIVNALKDGCEALGHSCPAPLGGEIDDVAMCLAKEHEPDFDTASGLYRIGQDDDFRFAGALAPWNWQLAFAKLLRGLPDVSWQARASAIVSTFLEEWDVDENGAVWRYWPEAYYEAKGLSGDKLAQTRFEDTGHAGISLLGLGRLVPGRVGEISGSLKDRLEFLLSFGSAIPRDLDGSGPRSERWFPAGGWAEHASSGFSRAYEHPVPGRTSADAIYAYAKLFDPAEEFHLKIDFFACHETCGHATTFNFENWKDFLVRNPFFHLARSEATPRE